jgi:uncharacterized RmlC-like cupin family protein
MTFIDLSDPQRQWLIAAEDGALTIFLWRVSLPQGAYGGLHWHDGDEAIRVIAGELRVTIGAERKICRAGEIAFFPPRIEHGFLVLVDAEIEVYGQQQMGEYVIVLDTDGTRREQEVFLRNPWYHSPPPGTAFTTREELFELFQTTRALL